MNSIIINKILIHHLDFEHRLLTYSDTFVDLNETSLEYYDKKVEKVFNASNLKEITVGNFHHLILRSKNMIETEEDFIRQSKVTAKELYDLGCLIGEMPNCDFMSVSCKKNGQDYILMVKLNYKMVPVTLVEEEEGKQIIRISKRQMLPSAASNVEEAILVNIDTNQLFLIEKKFNIDGKSQFYLNEQYIKGEPKLTDRQKLNATRKAIEKMDEVYHVNEVEPAPLFKKAMIECIEKMEPIIPVQLAKEVLKKDMQASEEAEDMLKELGIFEEDKITMDPGSIERMSRCKLSLDTDIEITMNIEDYLGGFYLQKERQEDGTIQIKLNGIKEFTVQ